MKSYLITLTSNGVEEKIMERFWEIKCLKNYLQYLMLKKEYEAKKMSASLTLKKKVEYVL
jgi:lipopolysaccharide biosynthesis protein